MELSEDLVANLANLSRIELSAEEIQKYSRELGALEELCTPLLSLSGHFSEAHRARGIDSMRKDVIGECLPREALLAIAPAVQDGYIPVPRAIEETAV